MGKDFTETNDNTIDSREGMGDDVSDFGGDLAADGGVDLNDGLSGIREKAVDLPPPTPNFSDLSQPPAIYADAPANNGYGIDVGEIDQLDGITPTITLPYDREIREGMGPGPEPNVEEPSEPDYGDHTDPPDFDSVPDIDFAPEIDF